MSKPLIFILFIFVGLSAIADECIQGAVSSNLGDLNLLTVDDTQIVTEDDLLYCPNQKLRNSNIAPEELPDNGSVWRVGNRRWNHQWEKEYQNWVKDNVQTDFFEKLNFPTDCADAAIAIRSIFARINNLPASFNGRMYSNTSKKYSYVKDTVVHWDKENWQDDFKKDKRFKKALSKWLVGTGTVNLHKDTYQTKIWDNENKRPTSCLAPGTVVLSEKHTEILTYAKESVLPYRISSSTIPARVRSLEESNFDFSMRVDGGKSDHINKTRGYLWWNWPINCKNKFVKVKDEQMPYYSDQQYRLNSSEEKEPISYDLNKAYQQSLGLSDKELSAKKKEEFYKSLESIKSDIVKRQQVVEEAIAFCGKNNINGPKDCFYPVAKKTKGGIDFIYRINDSGLIEYPSFNGNSLDIDSSIPCLFCAEELDSSLEPDNIVESGSFEEYFKPLNSNTRSIYDKYSTPSRDKRLKRKINFLHGLIYELDSDDWEEAKTEVLNTKVDLKNGKSISLYHITALPILSPQPWDSEEDRWGGAIMHKIKHDFNNSNKNELDEYESLKREYSKNPDAEKLEQLEKFKKENTFIIEEKKVIDEYFK